MATEYLCTHCTRYQKRDEKVARGLPLWTHLEQFVYVNGKSFNSFRLSSSVPGESGLKIYLLCMESNLLLHVTASKITLIMVKRIGDSAWVRDKRSSWDEILKLQKLNSASSCSPGWFHHPVFPCLMLRAEIILLLLVLISYSSESLVIGDYGCHLHIRQARSRFLSRPRQKLTHIRWIESYRFSIMHAQKKSKFNGFMLPPSRVRYSRCHSIVLTNLNSSRESNLIQCCDRSSLTEVLMYSNGKSRDEHRL